MLSRAQASPSMHPLQLRGHPSVRKVTVTVAAAGVCPHAALGRAQPVSGIDGRLDILPDTPGGAGR